MNARILMISSPLLMGSLELVASCLPQEIMAYSGLCISPTSTMLIQN